MSNKVNVTIDARVSGFVDGINQAKNAVADYETEQRRVQDNVGNFRKEFAAAKREVMNLAQAYRKLTDEENNSDIQTEKFVRWSKEGGAYILRFKDGRTGEPVLSRLAQELSMDFNIRAGGIQHLNDFDIGTMLVDFYGTDEKINDAINYLERNGVLVEKEDSKGDKN